MTASKARHSISHGNELCNVSVYRSTSEFAKSRKKKPSKGLIKQPKSNIIRLYWLCLYLIITLSNSSLICWSHSWNLLAVPMYLSKSPQLSLSHSDPPEASLRWDTQYLGAYLLEISVENCFSFSWDFHYPEENIQEPSNTEESQKPRHQLWRGHTVFCWVIQEPYSKGFQLFWLHCEIPS